MSRFRREDQRITSVAANWIAAPHLHRAVDHYAKSLHDAMRDGRMTGAQVAALGDDDHDRHFEAIAKANPTLARKPDPEPEPPRRSLVQTTAPHDYLPTKGK